MVNDPEAQRFALAMGERIGGRCDIVAFLPDGSVQRCTWEWGHYSLRFMARYANIGDTCRFDMGDDQELCGRRSLNYSRRTIRTCARPEGHADRCVYLSLTERPATYEEMGIPVAPEPVPILPFVG